MRMLSNLPRPCLDCGAHSVPGYPRCASCGRGFEKVRARKRASLLADGDRAAARLRLTVNLEGIARCSICYAAFPARFIEIDHRKPLADGGRDIASNTRPVCISCHRAKTAVEAHARAQHRRGG
jgi:5-methylcytosine-specific restriction endonuclease McrA